MPARRPSWPSRYRGPLESVLAVWAVAKTGAAFVPIDPNYPADRIAHMLADSGVDARRDHDRAPRPAARRRALAGASTTPTSRANVHGSPPAPVTDADRTGRVTLDNAAYVVYTSGSTGRPKGVVVTHPGLDELRADQLERFGATPISRTLHFSSPSFDGSVFEYLQAFGPARRW